MSDIKSTNLNIRDNKATAIASSSHNANVNAIGFNVLFIAQRDPKLAEELLALFNEARKVKESDPNAPEEDYKLFTDEITRLLDE